MPENEDRKIISAKGGVFNDLAARIKLILKLMADRRVSPLLKLLPLGSLVYMAVPDLAIGPIDDMMVIWLGAYLFVELCPEDVVKEHMETLSQTIPGEWREAQPPGETPKEGEGEVIEAEFWEKKEGE